MSDLESTNFMKLILFLCFQLLSKSDGRHVSDVLSELPAFEDDLVASAAEPRPVVVEFSQQAEVLPLVADRNSFGDSALSEASEKVEKILQRPIAFSYHDQSKEATEISEEDEEAKVVETDQRPDAVDYYNYLKSAESAESDDGAGSDEKLPKIKDVETENDEEKETENGKIRDHVNVNSDDQEQTKNGDDSVLENENYRDLTNGETGYKHKKNKEHDAIEDSEIEYSHVNAHHKKAGGGGGGGGGKGHHHEKGGGKDHHSSHKGEKGEKGDKGYKGHHFNEKGEKGHHTKEGHEKDYEEKEGNKKKYEHDDGYAAEHHKGEKGHKDSKFHEEGKHSKGHNTKGEHTIHKKDEYEKKQEFFDESHEEDGFEKEGDYYHESDYKKGGHEKGGFGKGGKEEAHYGKKHHHDKGGHFNEGKGHKDSKGHDSHYDHEHKHGDKESHSGGKKWHYGKGTGGGGGGGHKHAGKYQEVDASNVPIHVVEPDQQYKDNVIQSNIPKLTLEENPNYSKDLYDVIYPPLDNLHAQTIQPPKHLDKYEPFKQPTFAEQNRKRRKRIRPPTSDREQDTSLIERIVIQRRNDEAEDEKDSVENNLNAENSREFKRKALSANSPLKFDPYSDFDEDGELINDGRGSKTIGAYSIFRLGDYTTPKTTTTTTLANKLEEEINIPIKVIGSPINSEIQIQKPNEDNAEYLNSDEIISLSTDSTDVSNSTHNETTDLTTQRPRGFKTAAKSSGLNTPSSIRNEGYEKPKFVTISSETEHYETVAESTVSPIPDEANTTLAPLIEKETFSPNEETNENDDGEEQVISTSMQPIVVEDISSEEVNT